MPEALTAVLGQPALPWLCAAALAAGMVYGFAGFGAALVFMPISVALIGQALFDPAAERLYRRAAYGIIAASGLAGLTIRG